MNGIEGGTMLDVYMDGELGIERSLEVERHLESCPSCSAALASRRALGSGLRNKLAYHPAPLALHRAVRNELARAAAAPGAGAPIPRRGPPGWMRMAASVILAAGLSSALTSYYGTPRDSGVIPNEVFASHVRGVQSGERLVDVVSSDRHTVKPWLDAKLDFAAPVKDMSSAGFPLMGGRVDYIGEHTVAALVYQSRKHVITLFIWPSDGPAKPMTMSVRRGDNLAQWSDGAMTYWTISDVAAPELMDFTKRFQAAEPMPAAPASSVTKRP
jgi:anti-sigma factor RsiW